jgi:transposase InsO family protein
MEERLRFVLAAKEEGAVMTHLCAQYGISRQTGYERLHRYEAEGVEGLKDRSRAPHHHGRAHEMDLVEAALGLRDRYGWGAKKLRKKLGELRPDIELPAVSTIGDWLAKEGVTAKRRRRPRSTPSSEPLSAADRPNAVWTVDFKGWFRTGDGRRCDPLTLSDAMSRYLLRCQVVARPDYGHVRPVLEAAFCEFGLPQTIRSDNGPPFASTAAGGLSALSLWWIKLAIRPERIEPAKPQQNGRHERMHRTLKQDTAKPPAADAAQQQIRFDRFRQIFNNERPHEGLGLRYPAEVYQPSARAYPCGERQPEYGQDCAVRKVRSNGEIKWRGELVFVSQVLVGEPVAIEQTASGDWRVRYADIELGFIDSKRGRLSRWPLLRRRAGGLVDNAPGALPTSPPAQQQLPGNT